MPSDPAAAGAHVQLVDPELLVDALYVNHVAEVRSFLRRRTDDSELVGDLTGETFLRAYQHRQTFVGGNAAAWLMTIARNVLFDHSRRSGRRNVVLVDEFSGLEGAEPAFGKPASSSEQQVEERAALASAMRQLSPLQRRCLEHRFMEDRSIAETAALMGRSENAIKVLQHRAVAALRRELA